MARRKRLSFGSINSTENPDLRDHVIIRADKSDCRYLEAGLCRRGNDISFSTLHLERVAPPKARICSQRQDRYRGNLRAL